MPQFKNTCNAIYDDNLLYAAIQQKCKKLNKKIVNCYTIYLYNGYPCISIAHNKFRIHRLIAEFLYGDIRNYVIHHKDQNQLNNTERNLQLLSLSEHSKLHNKDKKYTPSLSAIKNARKTNYKKYITREKCLELKRKGFTINEIAKAFNCGINTINRRLGMKDYQTKNNVLDWSDKDDK